MLAKEINTFSKIIHNAFPHTQSALIVFVGDDYTRLDFHHLGKQGRIHEVPFGTKHLTERIAKAFNIPQTIASNYLALFRNNSLDAKTTRRVEEILESSRDEFVELWENGENFKVDSPYAVFLHAEAPFEEAFSSIIERISPHNKIGVFSKFLN